MTNTDDDPSGGISTHEISNGFNVNSTDLRLKEYFALIESNGNAGTGTSSEYDEDKTVSEISDLYADIAERLVLTHRPDLDNEDTKLALADAVFIEWSKQLHEVYANTVDSRGLTEEQAVAEQTRLIELIRQNGQISFADKLAFARQHPIRGITLGHVFNVARFQGTRDLDERIVDFTSQLEEDGENIVRIPKGEAIRNVSFSLDHNPNFGMVTRTRDVAWINDDNESKPELGGRIDTAIRKRSTFLIDYSHPKLRQQFELFQRTMNQFHTMTDIDLDFDEDGNVILPNEVSEDHSDVIDQAVHVISAQKKFLDGLVEGMIKNRDKMLIPVSTIYYVRQYNHHLDNVERPKVEKQPNRLKRVARKFGLLARKLTTRNK